MTRPLDLPQLPLSIVHSPQERMIRTLSAACIVALTIHVIYLVLFWVEGVRIMAYINIVSVSLYTLLIVLLRIKRFAKLAMWLTGMEMLFHQIFAIYFLGWDLGFQYFLFIVIGYAFLEGYRDFIFSAIFFIAGLGVFIIAFIYCQNGYIPPYTLNPLITRILHISSGVFISISVALMSYIFSKEAYQAERNLIAATEKDRELATLAAMLDGRLEAQHRISNELHSGLCSSLNGIRLDFSTILRDLDMISPEQRSRLDAVIEDLRNASKDVRRYSHELAPVVLEKFGLLDGMQEEARKINQSGDLQVEILNYGLEERLEKRIERNIYFILMELLLNAMKHAEAGEASIQFHKRNGRLTITYEDDGSGFDPKLAREKGGKGLIGMQIQARQLNGSLKIESEPGTGTIVIIDIPLNSTNHD